MKPIFPSQIEPHLTIVDFWLTPDSLVIQYVFRGNDYTLDLNQEQAIGILKKYGIIEDEEMLEIKVIDEDGYGLWVPFDDYATSTPLTEFDARQIVIGEISERSLDTWASGMRSIPDLINDILNPVNV